MSDRSVPPSPPAAPKRGTAQEAIRVIRDCYGNRDTWTPAELKEATGLTKYQVKTALAVLLASGAVNKTGSTRSVQYRVAEAKEVQNASAA